MTLPQEVEQRVLGLARQAIELQEDPLARKALHAALDAGDIAARWTIVDPVELEFGRMFEDPDGVVAIAVSVAGRPLACIEANRLGVYFGPDGEPFHCEPPPEGDQPSGVVWGQP